MKNILKSILVAFALITVVSCSEDDKAGYVYDGTGSRLFGFQNPTTRVQYFEDLGVLDEVLPVVMVGGADGTASTQDIIIAYTVDTANSTATEGVEFDFSDTSGLLTIPAGEVFTDFTLKINTANFSPTEPTSLFITLTEVTNSSSDVIASINETVEVVFIGCLSQLDSYTYDVTTVRADGATTAHGTQSLTFIGVNQFRTESVGLWAPGVLQGHGGYDFVDVCGVLTVAPQALSGIYTNQVYTDSPGSVDAVTGDFSITYAITFSGVPDFYTSTYIKQ
ncbi:hypothetical protein [Lacinutrix himadriensis]|uniref:hypothetical protein n=1 Tax=Lacinutrix himadriensis TaxID=641549 RepID=UPI0006E20618|nr:hypothetical protein [Lacinutrix himadriensis]